MPGASNLLVRVHGTAR